MDITPPQPAAFRRRWFILAILSLSLIIIGLDNTVLNVALPTIQRHFNASASELQWMVDAYILVYAGLLLVLGALGDRYGRKRALQVGLLLFAGFSVFAAYAQSAAQLITARALMGIGGALIMPSTLSIIVNVFPKHERGKAIGIWAGMAAVGIPLGPLLSGWLLRSYSWGSVFWINVPIALTALIIGAFLVPESRDPSAKRIDWAGALLSIGGLTALVYAIIEAPSRGWTDSLVLGGFTAAAVLLACFIIFEKKISQPMLDMNLFRNRRLSLGSGSIGIAFLALFGSIFLLTQYFQFVRGYSALSAGLRLLPFAIGMMLGSSNSHRLVRRFGVKPVITAGLVIIAVTLGTVLTLGVDTPYWILGTEIACMALGFALVMAPGSNEVMSVVPEENAGVGSALNDTVRQVGGALGVAILGSALNSVYSSHMAGQVARLPAAAAAAAQDSVGAATQIAATIGGPTGSALTHAAGQAFTDGIHVAVAVAAGFALAGAITVLAVMPSRRETGEHDHA